MSMLPRRALPGLAAALLPAAARAQGMAQGGAPPWPDRSVRLIVPTAPAGPTDVMARLIAPGLGSALGQSMVVENRGGAGGNIGVAVAARAAADGYAVLITSTGFVVNVSLFRNAGYTVDEFMPVTELGAAPNVFLARADSGITSIADLVARARATPGGLNFTNPGSGSTPHLAAELLRLRTGVELVQVAHNSAGLAVQALLAGTTLVGATSLPPALAQVKGGSLRALAVTASERFPDLPEVPTMQELGFPDFVSETFISMFLPLGTPPAILARLADATLKVVHDPATKARLLAAGFNVSGARGPEALAGRVAREVPMWRDLIRRAGIAQE